MARAFVYWAKERAQRFSIKTKIAGPFKVFGQGDTADCKAFGMLRGGMT